MRQSLLALPVVALLAGGCATPQTPPPEVVPVDAPEPEGNGKVQVGAPYIDFAAPKLGGGELKLSSLVGPNVVLIQFWGIRCAPCLAEFPFLAELQRRYGGRGLQVIGVNTDRVDAGRLSQAMAARQLSPPYPILLDSDFALSRSYTPWLIPVSVLVGRNGIVEAVHTGYKPELDSVIEAEVVRLLGR